MTMHEDGYVVRINNSKISIILGLLTVFKIQDRDLGSNWPITHKSLRKTLLLLDALGTYIIIYLNYRVGNSLHKKRAASIPQCLPSFKAKPVLLKYLLWRLRS